MSSCVWNDAVSIGDAICTFPGTLEFAKRLQSEGNDVEILWTRESAGDLFPHEKYGFRRVYELGPNYHHLSIHRAVHFGWKGHAQVGHPTAQFLAHVGFEGRSFTAPEIVYAETKDQYDVIIAPYVCADLGRFWPLDRWQAVIDALQNDFPRSHIGVLASAELPDIDDLRKIDPRSQERFAQNHAAQNFSLLNVQYLIDRPLPEVADLMRKAKVVATVDSGPARLMQSVNADHGTPHVLLCQNTVDRNWGTYPEAISIYQDLSSVQPQQVYALMREGLK